jgi:hypothetical protein
LDALARDGEAAWQRVDTLIRATKPKEYDQAVTLLIDLRDLDQREGRQVEFERRVQRIRDTYPKRLALLQRLDRADCRPCKLNGSSMATARRSAGPALGEFLTALRSRLDALPPEVVAAALIAHAERLPVARRQALLDIFPEPQGRPAGSGGPPQPDAALLAEALLADIAAFAARASAGEFAEDDDWYDRYDRRNDWEDEDGDLSWVEEADALFAAAGEAFVCGQLDLARDAYGRLLDVFGNAHGDGPILETWQLGTTDVDEALARHLRAVYETTPPQDRAAAVHRAFLGLPWCPSPPTLHDVAATREDGLPDLHAFLPDWIDRLLAETTRPSPEHRNRLLAEAAVLHRGVDGLADLARLPGPHAAGLHLAWVDALATADRFDEAADAAREAFDLPSADTPHRAAAADRLAEVTTRLADLTGAVEARRQAWRTEPTRRRLLALVTTAQSAGILDETLEAEARASTGVDRLTCELVLLAGHLDRAVVALAGSDPRGWSSPTHPGPVVLPCLWVAATTAVPPLAEGSHWGQAFASIDLDVQSLHEWQLDDLSEDDRTGRSDADDPSATSTPLTDLLTRAILGSPARPGERRRWLATAAATVEERVDAVVGNKHRRAYARVASLVVAHAEALAVAGKASDGRAYVTGIREKYPRHTAFRSELDTAVSTSTLISNHRPGPSASTRTARRPSRPYS